LTSNIHYNHGTTGAIDDIVSQLETISNSADTLSTYRYLGAGHIVEAKRG
jgi:hypothetical protein